MITELISRLDSTSRRVNGSLALSDEFKGKLNAQILVYGAFLTDVAEGQIPSDTPEHQEMLGAVGQFCDAVSEELPG